MALINGTQEAQWNDLTINISGVNHMNIEGVSLPFIAGRPIVHEYGKKPRLSRERDLKKITYPKVIFRVPRKEKKRITKMCNKLKPGYDLRGMNIPQKLIFAGFKMNHRSNFGTLIEMNL